MTVQEFQAWRIEEAARLLGHWVTTTETDRLIWQPAPLECSDSRTIYDMLKECAGFNSIFAGILRGDSPADSDSGDTKAPDPFCAPETAVKAVKDSAAELASVVRAMPESDLVKEFPFPWGDPQTGLLLITMPLENMMYHGGQVNYVQCLYGDTVFHYAKKEA